MTASHHAITPPFHGFAWSNQAICHRESPRQHFAWSYLSICQRNWSRHDATGLIATGTNPVDGHALMLVGNLLGPGSPDSSKENQCLNFLTDECVSDHSERIRSIQIDKNFITQTFRINNFIISRMRVQNKIPLQKLYKENQNKHTPWSFAQGPPPGRQHWSTNSPFTNSSRVWSSPLNGFPRWSAKKEKCSRGSILESPWTYKDVEMQERSNSVPGARGDKFKWISKPFPVFLKLKFVSPTSTVPKRTTCSKMNQSRMPYVSISRG